jgi:anthranilate synthase component 1
MHSPDFATFNALVADHQLVPVFRRLVCDSLTPVTAFHQLDAGTCACLFESVIGGEKVGRYSFLAAEPVLQLIAHNRLVKTIDAAGKSREWESPDPLGELERLVSSSRAAALPGLPPFCGGAVGYAGYDTVRYIERLPNPPADDRGLPDLSFALFHKMVVFDHIDKTMYVIVMARVGVQAPACGDSVCGPQAEAWTPAEARRAYDDACQEVDQVVARLSRPIADLPPADIDTSGEPRVAYESNFRREDFEEAVEKCLEYIRAGDIFQVVISQRLKTKVRVPPFEIYRTLRVVNPSPFMFYVRTPEVTLVGSSPEIMVRVVSGVVTLRPLAGTRRRGASEEEDRRLAAELLADPKERAEHVMLVDLGRNDVGRVAVYGSVEVSDVMTIERYSHVMHITSNVRGTLAEGKTAFDAMRSALPAGTVSGAPKVRSMQIIDELEPHRRGPYAGAVGYVDFSGNMDTCIALRTLVVQGDTAYIQAGAGIVADSVPSQEYEETLNKARGLLKAIEITERRVRAARQ